MAGREPTITRRRVLGAAAAIPAMALPFAVIASEAKQSTAEASLWNERLTRYRHLAARAKAAAETGWFRAANDRYYRACADPTADRKAAFARVGRAEDLYWRRCTDPMQKAAAALVLTPAPDLEALRHKLAVIRAHQLHELDCMSRDCFELLEEDVGQLRALTEEELSR